VAIATAAVEFQTPIAMEKAVSAQAAKTSRAMYAMTRREQSTANWCQQDGPVSTDCTPATMAAIAAVEFQTPIAMEKAATNRAAKIQPAMSAMIRRE